MITLGKRGSACAPPGAGYLMTPESSTASSAWLPRYGDRNAGYTDHAHRARARAMRGDGYIELLGAEHELTREAAEADEPRAKKPQEMAKN